MFNIDQIHLNPSSKIHLLFHFSVVMTSLRRLSTTTSILHDPTLVPVQVLEMAKQPSLLRSASEGSSSGSPPMACRSWHQPASAESLCKKEIDFDSSSPDDDSDDAVMLPTFSNNPGFVIDK